MIRVTPSVRIVGTTGQIEFADLSDPHVDDLLDDLGERVSTNGASLGSSCQADADEDGVGSNIPVLKK